MVLLPACIPEIRLQPTLVLLHLSQYPFGETFNRPPRAIAAPIGHEVRTRADVLRTKWNDEFLCDGGVPHERIGTEHPCRHIGRNAPSAAASRLRCYGPTELAMVPMASAHDAGSGRI